MTISSLDTLGIAKRLKEAGFSEAQAEAVTTVFRDTRAVDLADLATKADLRAETQRLETKIEGAEARLLAQTEILRRDVTIRLGSMIIAGVAILLAVKFFG